MTNELVKRLKDLGQGGFDLDFDALDKITPEARRQCAEVESLACEAAGEIEQWMARVAGAAEEILNLQAELAHKDAYYAQFHLEPKGAAHEPEVCALHGVKGCLWCPVTLRTGE